jgi:hypothetical protein
VFSSGLGFLSIIGINTTDAASTVAGGGTWEANVTCPDGSPPPQNVLTSAVSPNVWTAGYDCVADGYGGLPACFSWPVLPSTASPDVFLVTLSNGTKMSPPCIGITPNLEYNERHCLVLFGDFGTRYLSSDPRSVTAVSVEVVKHLKLVGPNGPVSAVGLNFTQGKNPYDPGNGPKFITAKISKLSNVGEGVFVPQSISQSPYPNDGITLYGSQANVSEMYRLRLFYTGGMTPDGVRGLQPVDFENYFYLLANSTSQQVNISKTNMDYSIGSLGSVKVLGLADTGKLEQVYSACYVDDKDNYIDIIIQASSPLAAAAITSVEAFKDGYGGLYNPGGPGNNPSPNLIFTARSSPQSVAVQDAILDPRTVTYCKDPQNGGYSTNATYCTVLYGPNATSNNPPPLAAPSPPSPSSSAAITVHQNVYVFLCYVLALGVVLIY